MLIYEKHITHTNKTAEKIGLIKYIDKIAANNCVTPLIIRPDKMLEILSILSDNVTILFDIDPVRLSWKKRCD
jgi:hypothetical protein